MMSALRAYQERKVKRLAILKVFILCIAFGLNLSHSLAAESATLEAENTNKKENYRGGDFYGVVGRGTPVCDGQPTRAHVKGKAVREVSGSHNAAQSPPSLSLEEIRARFRYPWGNGYPEAVNDATLPNGKYDGRASAYYSPCGNFLAYENIKVTEPKCEVVKYKFGQSLMCTSYWEADYVSPVELEKMRIATLERFTREGIPWPIQQPMKNRKPNALASNAPTAGANSQAPTTNAAPLAQGSTQPPAKELSSPPQAIAVNTSTNGRKVYGEGVARDKQGTYEGALVNGVRQGFGVMTYDNGRRYEGEWKNDLFDGYGELQRKDGTSIYVGEWKEGFYHGKGRATYGPNGNVEWREGGWVDGQPFGKSVWHQRNDGLEVLEIYNAEHEVVSSRVVTQAQRSDDNTSILAAATAALAQIRNNSTNSVPSFVQIQPRSAPIPATVIAPGIAGSGRNIASTPLQSSAAALQFKRYGDDGTACDGEASSKNLRPNAPVGQSAPDYPSYGCLKSTLVTVSPLTQAGVTLACSQARASVHQVGSSTWPDAVARNLERDMDCACESTGDGLRCMQAALYSFRFAKRASCSAGGSCSSFSK